MGRQAMATTYRIKDRTTTEATISSSRIHANTSSRRTLVPESEASTTTVEVPPETMKPSPPELKALTTMAWLLTTNTSSRSIQMISSQCLLSIRMPPSRMVHRHRILLHRPLSIMTLLVVQVVLVSIMDIMGPWVGHNRRTQKINSSPQLAATSTRPDRYSAPLLKGSTTKAQMILAHRSRRHRHPLAPAAMCSC
jgi:hypothetical protein